MPPLLAAMNEEERQIVEPMLVSAGVEGGSGASDRGTGADLSAAGATTEAVEASEYAYSFSYGWQCF